MIHLENLSYRYRSGAALALDSVSLDIARGSIHGLLGPNGAGKTTLLSLLAGLFRLQEGRIAIGDKSLEAWRASRPSAIALVPQDYAFYPILTVAENLAFFAGVQGIPCRERQRRCAEALTLTRLETVTNQRAKELSGGLRRRLNLAIGLISDPEILLLDEPTVGVDSASRRFLLETVRDLVATGRTVIYTSHYMEEIEVVCTDVSIVDHGKVLEAGPIEEVKRGRTLEQAFAELTGHSLRD